MRTFAAACVAALLGAAPAAAVSGKLAIAKLGRPIQLTTLATAGKDKSQTCQAGKSKRTKTGLIGTKQRFAVVACEQPPRSEFVTPSAVAKATAAALATLG